MAALNWFFSAGSSFCLSSASKSSVCFACSSRSTWRGYEGGGGNEGGVMRGGYEGGGVMRGVMRGGMREL